jgi:CRISPR-associated protein Cas5a/b/c
MSTPTRDVPGRTPPGPGQPGHFMVTELRSQPALWRRAGMTARSVLDRLPGRGESVLVLGCGTSYYIADAYARRRVAAGRGPTRAAIPSELDTVGDDETVVLLSRSGTTGDLIRAAQTLGSSHRTVAVTGMCAGGLSELVSDSICLDYADESSVVQTRFATTSLTLLRKSLGEDIEPLAADADRALDADLPVTAGELRTLKHVVFLGTRWTAALAQEAALKIREAAGFWTEAYPLHEYQHGPISCAGPDSLIWSLSDVPSSVADDIAATGAKLAVATLDPQAELVRVHRLAVSLAFRQGRDPDTPPHLSRSVEHSEM